MPSNGKDCCRIFLSGIISASTVVPPKFAYLNKINESLNFPVTYRILIKPLNEKMQHMSEWQCSDVLGGQYSNQ